MLYANAFLRRIEDGLRGVLPAWGLPAGCPVRLLAVSENATFLAGEGAARPPVVLRVYRPGYRSAAEILSELAWIEALRADRVVETPHPLRTVDGGLLVPFGDRDAPLGAVAFEHVGGREPEADADPARLFARLGATAARLHDHARRWTRPPSFVRGHWTFDTIVGRRARWGDWRAAPGLDPAGRVVLERVCARLEAECAAFGEGPDRFGLAHCDMRAANLLADGDRLALIDFDDCGPSWFGFDFAAAVSFREHEPIVPALRAAWLDGYRGVGPFPAGHERALSLFVMLRRLQLTAWIASRAETPTAARAGADYAAGTVRLAGAYLSESGTP